MTEPKPEYTPTRAPIATLLDDERAERERLRATSRAYKLCAKKWRAISLQAETELAAAQDRINALRLQSGYSVVCASCGSTIDPTGTPMVCDRCYSNEYANGEQMTVDVNKWRDTAHTVETIAEKEIERLRAELAQVRVERDALAAMCNELRESASRVLHNTATHGACSAMELTIALGSLSFVAQSTPAASLAAHDAALWREASELIYAKSGDYLSDSNVVAGFHVARVLCERRAAELDAQAGEVTARLVSTEAE